METHNCTEILFTVVASDGRKTSRIFRAESTYAAMKFIETQWATAIYNDRLAVVNIQMMEIVE